MYYVYILRCVDNSLYTGIATDVKRRFKEHAEGRGSGAKYTRSHKPLCVEAVWRSESRSDASKLEAYIKNLPKTHKNKLIESPLLLSELCNDKLEGKTCQYEPEYTKYCIK